MKIVSAVLPMLILFFLYYVVSLLDLWERMHGIIQATFLILIVSLGLGLFVFGMLGKTNINIKFMTRRLAVVMSVSLIVALLSGNEFSRLTTLAFKPRALFDYPEPEVMATLTPPLYLEQESVSIKLNVTNSENQTLSPVHEGSVLDLKVVGTGWAPSVYFSDGSKIPLEEMDDGSFTVSTKIDQQTSWSLRQGDHVIGSWPIILLDDEAPEIDNFSLEEHENDKGYLAFNVDVDDDRKIMRADIIVEDQNGIIDESHSLAIREVKSQKTIYYLDLTGSNLAGGPADVTLLVEDEAGQITRSTLVDVDIPQKEYNSGIAAKLISLRKELSQPSYDRRALARQIKALGLLGDNEGLPPIYYMALRSAYWRLIEPVKDNDQVVARDLLWDIAQKVESSEAGVIENDLIKSLDELNLSIRQKKPMNDIREGLRSADGLFREYRQASESKPSDLYSLEIDVKALRKLYSYILAFSDQDKHYNATLIVDFMRKALVQNDALIFSKDGLGNYFALSESRQIINNLISIQKTLLATSYNDQMQNRINKRINKAEDLKKNQKLIDNQLALQTKVGAAVRMLGEKISFAGGSSEFLIQNASDLVDEILVKMKKSEVSDVAQSQNELITIMSNLKRVLSKPVSRSPELQNIIKEINSRPVL